MKKLFVSNKDESVRMFEKNWMEALSKVHWSIPLILFSPVVIWCIYTGLSSFDYPILKFAGIFMIGLISWTVTEYVMHRFVFHYHPSSKFGQRIHFIMHGVHHDYPNDSRRLVLPPSISLPLALAFYFLFTSIFSGYFFYPFYAGFILGYIAYDTLHYAIHHVNFKGKLWNVLKTHHLKHHYNDDTKGYGVSSPLWDLIVGSDFDKKNLSTNKTNEPTHSSTIEH
jgi:sterol desaturase/sphingolipid hydroxylase (fatty acid hydroxylase superfamily)